MATFKLYFLYWPFELETWKRDVAVKYFEEIDKEYDKSKKN